MAEKSDGINQGKASLEKKFAGEKVCMFSTDSCVLCTRSVYVYVSRGKFLNRMLSPPIIIALSTQRINEHVDLLRVSKYDCTSVRGKMIM